MKVYIVTSLLLFCLMLGSFIKTLAKTEDRDRRGGAIIGLSVCIFFIFGGLFALFS